MFSNDETAAEQAEQRGWFTTTHWSVVLSAQQGTQVQAGQALEKLCRTYWYPLYAFARRQGHDVSAAQDLTQGFFARLLAKDYLEQVHRDKGKFRSFLLAAFKHFMSDERSRATAAKRGGGQILISLDEFEPEDRYAHEPVTDLSPEKIFERHWALALIEKALANLEDECRANGKGALFDALKVFLEDGAGSGNYSPVAVALGMSAGAIAVAVHRLRQRYRELVRQEIANTVRTVSEIDEEMRHLLAVLAG
jgi:RNA polymerase sigma-70 factor (ECF subfamily)